ncbi:MAG TPA: protein kinase [Bryobacteraceae bacterium]|nr:protein kinase [Bryobacteraceae bacterium]
MALSAGTLLGAYEILAPIGAGGMGEVYRARDTKLKRDVALKVLPEAFAKDPGRMERFQREAEVLASLNHPNIAHIYGVEERALVMELVEGSEPAGPLAFEDAWKIASQIADALEYAHERGVVHRDLKPANIKVTPDGVVKLLDFGLAKAFSEPGGAASADAVNSPTLTMGPSVAGVILGTAAYMSPEQARGKTVDRRADIWAFGVVLYELLTGKQLFQGEDLTETLASVVKDRPDLGAAPERARKLLEACLEKDPKKRLQSIGDARYLLGSGIADSPPAQARGTRKLPWVLAAAGVTAAIAVSFIHFREAPPPKPVLRYTIAAPENATFLHSFAISPDGRLLALAVDVKGKRQLFLRAMDSLQAQPLPGTDDATYPFWSPDSRYIGFFAQGKLKKIAASGGPAQSLCDALIGQGGSWNRDDVIVFSPRLGGGVIQRVSAAGGVPADVATPKGVAALPEFLPDGRHFLFRVGGASEEQNGVYLSSLDGKENRRVLADVSSVVVSGGRLLFVRENTLMAQSFDFSNGQARGDAFPAVEGVSVTTNLGYAPITVSDTGVLLYQSGGVGGQNNQMAWYDRAGKLLQEVGDAGRVLDPAISPDEKSIVFRRQPASGADLWLRDLARGAESRFTTDPSINFAPFWSPRGDRIVFSSNRGSGVISLYQKAASGTGPDELLLAGSNGKFPTQWSRDGRLVVFSEVNPKTRLDIWVLPMDGAAQRKPFAFLHSEFNELYGQLSPDSRWMAYTSDESGQREVYVRPFPAGEGQWRISISGGEQPRWRGDGRELFFVGADGKIMSAALKLAAGARPSLEPSTPQPLFATHLAHGPADNVLEYDVTTDGKRFLLDTTGSGSAPILNVVVNWDAGLKK